MQDSDLLKTLDALDRPRVLVLGDFILDLYTWGDAERISQEAPVIVLRADRSEYRLGGAGNVCQLLRGLEARVTCAGVVGSDDDGNHVREMLEDCGVDCQFLMSSSRPTTTKQRYIGRAANRHPHQILRVDQEQREPIGADSEDQLIDQLESRLDRFEVVLVSDYGKGVCTPRLLRRVIHAARAAGIPVVVDPVLRNNYELYSGATAITPNRREAEHATGVTIDQPEKALQAAAVLCRQADLEMAFVTLDRDGMAVLHPQQAQQEIYATRPRAVYDITGAGDMVLATIGICLAAKCSPAQAAQLANVTGGLEVEHVGVAVIRREEIRNYLLAEQQPAAAKVLEHQPLTDALNACRARGQRIVFTNGCFDLLHVGHITYLQQAATMGDVLVIGLNSDPSVRALKGPKRPVISQQDRAAILAALACVDFVAIFDEQTPQALIQRVRPDVLVKGGDYRPEEIVGRQFVESYGGQVVVTPIVAGVSTTKILKTAAA
jgi:D-beta-D-heptose 7-phosphate kinase/D-beta-D-heptose 1-phosphate adenosyltransferase